MGNERRGFRPRYEGGFRQRGRTGEISHRFSKPADAALSRRELPIRVTRDAIERFCGGCDYLDLLSRKDTCRIADSNDQARYVDRRWCGWASENTVRGEMTARGFQNGDSPAKPQQPSAR